LILDFIVEYSNFNVAINLFHTCGGISVLRTCCTRKKAREGRNEPTIYIINTSADKKNWDLKHPQMYSFSWKYYGIGSMAQLNSARTSVLHWMW
jgi:hypothetical protein